MTGRPDVLDLLVAGAPPLPRDHARALVRRARRRQRRRRGACLAGAAGVTAAVAAGAVALSGPGPGTGAVSVTEGPATSVSPSVSPSVPPAPSPAVSDEAAIDAAAIRRLAAQVGDGRRWPVLYVLDHRVEGIVTDVEGQRPAGVLDPAARAGLVAALADYAPVRFVPRVADAWEESGGQVRDGGAFVVLGVPRPAAGGRVRLEVTVQASGKGGEGVVFLLGRVDGRWAVIGDTGEHWIS